MTVRVAKVCASCRAGFHGRCWSFHGWAPNGRPCECEHG